jgi:hypothetical protein
VKNLRTEVERKTHSTEGKEKGGTTSTEGVEKKGWRRRVNVVHWTKIGGNPPPTT